MVGNSSVSLSLTLVRNKKVEHYITIKTHKPIVLRFWVESGVYMILINDKHRKWLILTILIKCEILFEFFVCSLINVKF